MLEASLWYSFILCSKKKLLQYSEAFIYFVHLRALNVLEVSKQESSQAREQVTKQVSKY